MQMAKSILPFARISRIADGCVCFGVNPRFNLAFTPYFCLEYAMSRKSRRIRLSGAFSRTWSSLNGEKASSSGGIPVISYDAFV